MDEFVYIVTSLLVADTIEHSATPFADKDKALAFAKEEIKKYQDIYLLELDGDCKDLTDEEMCHYEITLHSTFNENDALASVEITQQVIR